LVSGVTRRVEPLHGQPLAQARRGQQAIDDLLVSARRLVGDKGVQLGQRRRQPRQVEREPAEQYLTGRFRGRRQPRALEPGEHEPIDAITWPV